MSCTTSSSCCTFFKNFGKHFISGSAVAGLSTGLMAFASAKKYIELPDISHRIILAMIGCVGVSVVVVAGFAAIFCCLHERVNKKEEEYSELKSPLISSDPLVNTITAIEDFDIRLLNTPADY